MFWRLYQFVSLFTPVFYMKAIYFFNNLLIQYCSWNNYRLLYYFKKTNKETKKPSKSVISSHPPHNAAYNKQAQALLGICHYQLWEPNLSGMFNYFLFSLKLVSFGLFLGFVVSKNHKQRNHRPGLHLWDLTFIPCLTKYSTWRRDIQKYVVEIYKIPDYVGNKVRHLISFTE